VAFTTYLNTPSREYKNSRKKWTQERQPILKIYDDRGWARNSFTLKSSFMTYGQFSPGNSLKLTIGDNNTFSQYTLTLHSADFGVKNN